MFFKEFNDIFKEFKSRGAECFVVGGSVRDILLGEKPKDLDIEVFGMRTAKEILDILKSFGKVDTVGASFGIIKFKRDGIEADFSLPRRDIVVGPGHKDFNIVCDEMTPKQAASRRDFTINAMMMDPLTGVIFDFFGGKQDLEGRVLRHVSPAFEEDPLRVLRAMQFAGRFNMKLDWDTAKFCQTIIMGANFISAERFWIEWQKWALKSKVPSKGLRVLMDTNWIEIFPELNALVGLEQDPVWHPEGDTFTHIMHSVDKAAEVADRDNLNEEDRIVLMMAVLCHDFGKPTTTATDDDGRIRAKGHCDEGVEPTANFLNRMKVPTIIVDRVCVLVKNHMAGVSSKDKPTKRAVRRLAKKLADCGETIEMLSRVSLADFGGRPPLTGEHPFEDFLRVAEDLDIKEEGPKPILMGRHLLELGHKPGPGMGELLKEAFNAQLDGVFDNVDAAIEWAKEKGDISNWQQIIDKVKTEVNTDVMKTIIKAKSIMDKQEIERLKRIREVE